MEAVPGKRSDAPVTGMSILQGGGTSHDKAESPAIRAKKVKLADVAYNSGDYGYGDDDGNNPQLLTGGLEEPADEEDEEEDVAEPTDTRLKRKSMLMQMEAEPDTLHTTTVGDFAGGSSCHQCKSRRSTDDLTFCANQLSKKNKSTGTLCRKKYCEHCLKKFYKELPPTGDAIHTWKCPACRGLCCCAACRKRLLRDQAKVYNETGMPPPSSTTQSMPAQNIDVQSMAQHQSNTQDMMYYNQHHTHAHHHPHHHPIYHSNNATSSAAVTSTSPGPSSGSAAAVNSSQHPSLFSHVTQTTNEDTDATAAAVSALSGLRSSSGGTNTTSPTSQQQNQSQHGSTHYGMHHHHWPTSPQTTLATLHNSSTTVHGVAAHTGSSTGSSHLSPHQTSLNFGVRATLGTGSGHPRLSPSFEPAHPVYGLGPQAQKLLAASSASGTSSTAIAATPASTSAHGGSVSQSPLSGPVNAIGAGAPVAGALGTSAAGSTTSSVAHAIIRPRLTEHLQQRQQQQQQLHHQFHHHQHHHHAGQPSATNRLLAIDTDSSPILSSWQNTTAGGESLYGSTPLFLHNHLNASLVAAAAANISKSRSASPTNAGSPKSSATQTNPPSSSTHPSTTSAASAAAASAVASVFAAVAGAAAGAAALGTNTTNGANSAAPSPTATTTAGIISNTATSSTLPSTASTTSSSKAATSLSFLTSPALVAMTRSNPFPTLQTQQAAPAGSVLADFHTFALCWVLCNNPTVQVSLNQICSSDASLVNKVDSVANALRSAAITNTGVNYVHAGSITGLGATATTNPAATASTAAALAVPTSGQLNAAASPAAPSSLDAMLGQAAASVAGLAAGNTNSGGNTNTVAALNRFTASRSLLSTGSTSPLVRGVAGGAITTNYPSGFVSLRQSASNPGGSVATSPSLSGASALRANQLSRVLMRTANGNSTATGTGNEAGSQPFAYSDSSADPASSGGSVNGEMAAQGSDSHAEGEILKSESTDDLRPIDEPVETNKHSDSVTSGESLPADVKAEDDMK